MNPQNTVSEVDEGPHVETKLDTLISRVLTTGLVIAIALLVVGVILTVARPGLASTHEASIAGIPRAVVALEPTGFFALGLVVLLLTPVARVVALLVAFARRRQWLFCGFSAAVLVMLALGAFLGLEIA